MHDVLVTGGAGFIGSHFVRRLMAAGDITRVTVLDALTYAGSRENLGAADRRLLASFDGPDGITGNWRTAEGAHSLAVGKTAHDLVRSYGASKRESRA